MVVVEEHDDAVPLHSLGDALLRGDVAPVIALRVARDLVKVRAGRVRGLALCIACAACCLFIASDSF
jgi:hypothetical protein